MGISKASRRAFSVIGVALVVTLANSASTLASPAIHAAPAPAVATASAVVAAPARKPAAPKAAAHSSQQADEAAKPAPKAHELRRLKGSEVTPAIAKTARRIINANYTKPFGTEIPFEIGGKHYIGRIERHYHPPGGKLHPWGYHHGCSVFVVVGSAS